MPRAMPRLPALLLASLLLLAPPVAQAGDVVFEIFVLRGDGVELRIGTHRHVPHGWHPSWNHGHQTWSGWPGWQSHGGAWGHPRVQQRGPRQWHGHGGYDARDVRRAWRQGFQAGRRHDDSPRWHGGWSR
jgi:hypothetical protein